jgi:hypothetical protein
MIKPEKLPNALYALHGVLIQARAMAYRGVPAAALADILDDAELLPRLLASQVDETDKFRMYLEEMARKHQAMFVVQRFDQPAPHTW